MPDGGTQHRPFQSGGDEPADGGGRLEELVQARDIDDMVSEVRREVQSPRGLPAEEAGKGGSLCRGSVSLVERGPENGALWIRPLTQALVSMTASASLADFSPCHASRRSGKGDPVTFDIPDEMQVKDCLRVIIERLSCIESRLDEWRAEQQGLVENTLQQCRRPGSYQKSGRTKSPKRGTFSEEEPVADESEGPGEQLQRHNRKERSLRSDASRRLGPALQAVAVCNANSEGGDLAGLSSSDCRAISDPREAKQLEEPSHSKPKLETRRTKSSSISKRQTLFQNGLHKAPSERMGASMLAPVVQHPAFDCFVATMIILNSLFIGVQTEFRMQTMGQDEPVVFDAAEKVFAGVFMVELAMRMAAMKSAFFARDVIFWNIFDMVLVAMSAMEVFLSVIAGNSNGAGNIGANDVGKVIRMCRMARIVRIMRVLRFMAELRTMVTMILQSARSLFWCFILMSILLYIFAIFFTQGVTNYLTDPANAESGVRTQLMQYYGGMLVSAGTLYASITGGVGWHEVLLPLARTGWVFTLLFVTYNFFCVFSVLNLITAVFVDGAIQRSSQERDARLEREKEQKTMYVSMLTELLQEIDVENTGVITREDLADAFLNEQVRYYFSVLDIDVTDSNYLFDMLDLDRSGEVDMTEFVNGCLRLKGNAKSIDIHTLTYEVKLMIQRMTSFIDCWDQGPP